MKIVICGIGGQGVVTLAEIIGYALFKMGKKVRLSYVLGMAQRGGGVVCHVKEGHSPLNITGDVDCLVALEKEEGVKNLVYKPKTALINDFCINRDFEQPAPHNNMWVLKASSIAKQHGNIRYSNTLMLRSFVEYFNLDRTIFKKSLERYIKKDKEKNLFLFSSESLDLYNFPDA